MVFTSPQIKIGLLLISIGIVVNFDIKIDQLNENNKKKLDILVNIYINLINKELPYLDQE